MNPVPPGAGRNPERRSGPIDPLIEYTVFAPLGFALEARSLLPRFVDRGRSQVMLARVVGKYAVTKGAVAAEGVALRLQEHGLGLLRLGVRDQARHSEREASAPHGDPTSQIRVVATSPSEGTGSDTDTEGRTVPRDEPSPDSGHLAISDYDSLSASQVVPRLDGLTGEELEDVRGYEAATRARRTILNKIAQLQSA